MFRFKASKFKNAAPRIPKREFEKLGYKQRAEIVDVASVDSSCGVACLPEEVQRHVLAQVFEGPYKQCFTDLPIGTLMSSSGNYVKASCKFVACNVELGGGGGIAVLNLEEYGRKGRSIPIIHGHGEFVSDMDFSPFDDCLLATGSYDGYVKLWKIPEDGLTETLSNADLALPPSEKRIENVLFHPSASDVLAVTVLDELKIYDVSDGSLKYSFDNQSDKPFQGMSWKADGSLLITSCKLVSETINFFPYHSPFVYLKDTKLRVIDPRQSSVAMETSGHQGTKDSRAVWLGNKENILSTGFSKGRERMLGIWDTRNFNNPICTDSPDSSSGTMMPFYDPDTNMLLCGGKGDLNVRFYEITDTDPFLTLASAETLEKPTFGMGMVPKRAMHLMEAEVNRLLQLTKDTIVPLSYIVPRRTYVEFYPELYPETACGEPAMTAEEWFSGNTKEVDKIKLKPEQEDSSSKGSKKVVGLKGLKSKAEENKEPPTEK